MTSADTGSALGRVAAIAGLTFREAWRRKVVVAALVMTLGFLGLYALGLHYIGADLEQHAGPGAFGGEIYRQMLAAQLLYMGLFPSSLIVGLMAVLASAGSISSELDTGVLYGVLARPIRRWELVAGKFLGIGLMVSIYTVALVGAVVALARWQVASPLNDVPPAIALLVLEPLILLSVAVLGSSRLSTMATGVLCIAAYGMGVVGGFIEQIGSFTSNATMANIGIMSSLLMPVDAIHRKAVTLLLPSAALLGNEMGPAGVGAKATPSGWMVVYAVVYVLGALVLAARGFAERDL